MTATSLLGEQPGGELRPAQAGGRGVEQAVVAALGRDRRTRRGERRLKQRCLPARVGPHRLGLPVLRAGSAAAAPTWLNPLGMMPLKMWTSSIAPITARGPAAQPIRQPGIR